jgi:hypothetical protein
MGFQPWLIVVDRPDPAWPATVTIIPVLFVLFYPEFAHVRLLRLPGARRVVIPIYPRLWQHLSMGKTITIYQLIEQRIGQAQKTRLKTFITGWDEACYCYR